MGNFDFPEMVKGGYLRIFFNTCQPDINDASSSDDDVNGMGNLPAIHSLML